ncbi:MAG: Stf0 family sulfotransferase [Cyanobacteria bacterium P01_H01_bin.105]
MPLADSISAELLPTTSIIICSTGRSGSNLLGLTLGSIGYAGKASEFFRPDVLAKSEVGSNASELYAYMTTVYDQGSTPNRVFGVKLHWDHMADVLKLVRTDPLRKTQSDIEILSELFPNPKFVFIRRRNLVKQAISMEIGKQTGVYLIRKKRLRNSSAHKEQTLFFKPLNIYRYKQGVQRRNQKWRSFFEKYDLPFFEVVYEDLVKDFDEIMRQVIEFAGVDLPETDIEITKATKKQGNKINERWLIYYRAIPEGLLAAYSEFRSYLRKVIVSS